LRLRGARREQQHKGDDDSDPLNHVADHVPDGADFGKLDCLDAIELHLLRPAAAELQKAYQKAYELSA
jgi:hypothetical protein